MSKMPVQQQSFRVDTRRPRSRSKLRAKFRQVMAVSAGMFPLMAVFIFLMSFWQIQEQRKGLFTLALVFAGCGMVSLLVFLWARADKARRQDEFRSRQEQKQARLDRQRLQAARQAQDASAGKRGA